MKQETYFIGFRSHDHMRANDMVYVFFISASSIEDLHGTHVCN